MACPKRLTHRSQQSSHVSALGTCQRMQENVLRCAGTVFDIFLSSCIVLVDRAILDGKRNEKEAHLVELLALALVWDGTHASKLLDVARVCVCMCVCECKCMCFQAYECTHVCATSACMCVCTYAHVSRELWCVCV
jgi:hypothetical protein